MCIWTVIFFVEAAEKGSRFGVLYFYYLLCFTVMSYFIVLLFFFLGGGSRAMVWDGDGRATRSPTGELDPQSLPQKAQITRVTRNHGHEIGLGSCMGERLEPHATHAQIPRRHLLECPWFWHLQLHYTPLCQCLRPIPLPHHISRTAASIPGR